MSWFVALLCAVALSGAAAQPVSPLSADLKQKVLAGVRELPDHSCTATVERGARRAGARDFEMIDRARFEVAYRRGQESFGWPGGERIAGDDLARMTSGTITTGDFPLQVRGVFTNGKAVFREAGDENRAGAAALRYDVQVPAQGSDWLLSGPGRDIAVAYHGSFWVEKETHRLVELDLTADTVPSELGFTSVSKRLSYERTRIGGEDALLPARSELISTDASGGASRAAARFHDCRPYTSEKSASAAGAVPVLPDEFDIEVALETPIDSDTAAAGDPVTARTLQTVKRKRETVVPKGTILRGRISNLELNQGHRFLDLTFTEFEVDGTRIDIRGRSNELDVLDRMTTSDLALANPKLGPMSGRNVQTVSSRVALPMRTSGSHLKLARGFKLFLKSSGAAGHDAR